MRQFRIGALSKKVGSIAAGTLFSYHPKGYFRLTGNKRAINRNSPLEGFRDVVLSEQRLNHSTGDDQSLIEVNLDSRTPLFMYVKLENIFSQDKAKYADPLRVLDCLVKNYHAKNPLPGEKIERLAPVELPDELELSLNMCFLAAGTRLRKDKNTSKYKVVTSFYDISAFGIKELKIDPLYLMTNSDLLKGMGGFPELLKTANDETLSQRLLIKKLKHLVAGLGCDESLAVISNLDCVYETSIDEHKPNIKPHDYSYGTGNVLGFLGAI